MLQLDARCTYQLGNGAQGNKGLLLIIDYPEEQARLLNNLSIYFAEAGELLQGLKAIQRAVSIYEQLAEQNFAAYAPDLAVSLNNLSNRLAEAGERQQGLEAIQRAVSIRKQLAK